MQKMCSNNAVIKLYSFEEGTLEYVPCPGIPPFPNPTRNITEKMGIFISYRDIISNNLPYDLILYIIIGLTLSFKYIIKLWSLPTKVLKPGSMVMRSRSYLGHSIIYGDRLTLHNFICVASVRDLMPYIVYI